MKNSQIPILQRDIDEWNGQNFQYKKKEAAIKRVQDQLLNRSFEDQFVNWSVQFLGDGDLKSKVMIVELQPELVGETAVEQRGYPVCFPVEDMLLISEITGHFSELKLYYATIFPRPLTKEAKESNKNLHEEDQQESALDHYINLFAPYLIKFLELTEISSVIILGNSCWRKGKCLENQYYSMTPIKRTQTESEYRLKTGACVKFYKGIHPYAIREEKDEEAKKKMKQSMVEIFKRASGTKPRQEKGKKKDAFSLLKCGQQNLKKETEELKERLSHPGSKESKDKRQKEMARGKRNEQKENSNREFRQDYGSIMLHFKPVKKKLEEDKVVNKKKKTENLQK